LAYEFRAVRPSLSAFAGEGARATKYPSAIILGDEVDELSTEGKHKVPFGRLRAGSYRVLKTRNLLMALEG